MRCEVELSRQVSPSILLSMRSFYFYQCILTCSSWLQAQLLQDRFLPICKHWTSSIFIWHRGRLSFGGKLFSRSVWGPWLPVGSWEQPLWIRSKWTHSCGILINTHHLWRLLKCMSSACRLLTQDWRLRRVKLDGFKQSWWGWSNPCFLEDLLELLLECNAF